MARLSVAAAGSADKNINLINARFQAEALRRIRGYDCGVLDNSFYSPTSPNGKERTINSAFMWSLAASNITNITVGRGMATAYGFDLQSEETVRFTATAPSAGTKYLFIYLEWDFSNPVEAVGKIDIHDNGSGGNWTPPRQDNLITNPIGTYQMPLYRLAVSTTGAIVGVISWKSLGVLTVEESLISKYARDAFRAEEAKYAEGNTDEGTIDQRLKSIVDRLDKLGFRSGVFQISVKYDEAPVNELKRQGNYVILNISFRVNTGTGAQLQGSSGSSLIIGVLPEQYRPINQITAPASIEVYHKSGSYNYSTSTTHVDATISINGEISIKKYNDYVNTSDWLQGFVLRNIGFEARPIT